MIGELLRHQLPVHSPLTARAILAASRPLSPASPAEPHALLAALLRREYGAAQALLFGSGTQALTAAIIAAAGDRRDAVVALPGYACYDVLSAAVGAEARVILYDIDARTLGPDPESLARALQQGATTLVIASLYGLPYDWEAISTLARRHGVIIIEDAAQAAGACWNGRPLGTLGDMTVLSFGRGKGWTGCGGGALLARDTDPALKGAEGKPPAGSPARALSAIAQWLLGRPAAYGLPRALPWLGLGETVYRPPRAPAPMATFHAALALATHPLNADERMARRRNTTAYAELGVPLPPAPVQTAGWLRLPLLVPAAVRPQLLQELRSLGLEPGYPASLATLSAHAHHAARLLPLPGAERLASSLVTLPTHSLTTDRDRTRIARTLRKYRIHS